MSVNSHGNSNNNSNGRTNDQPVSPGESDSDKDKVYSHNIVHYCCFLTYHAKPHQVNTSPNTEKSKTRSPQLKSKKSLLLDSHYSGTPTGLLNMKSHFVLVFGDHTYQQYGLCMRMPMKFTDPTNQVRLFIMFSWKYLAWKPVDVWSGRGSHVIRGVRYVQVSILQLFIRTHRRLRRHRSGKYFLNRK